jgi:prepilin-type N-terminal cleavage/methylation domain-containing protein
VKQRRAANAGVTLMEVLIAVTLLSLLMLGMSIAMRVAFNAYAKTDEKLMDNRRVAGAQRLLEQELQGMVPLVLPCLGAGEGGSSLRFAMFQGHAQVMRLASTFSLQQGWRGEPQLLELFVIPGEEGRGVRLVVNEIPYTPAAAGRMCAGFVAEPGALGLTRYLPPVATEHTFVLADKLAFCRFTYLQHPMPDPPQPQVWLPALGYQGWPMAVRIEMAPLEVDPSRLQPIAMTVPFRVYRAPDIPYADY